MYVYVCKEGACILEGVNVKRVHVFAPAKGGHLVYLSHAQGLVLWSYGG